jgi:ribonuclease BN (tRNA processing enzyme)
METRMTMTLTMLGTGAPLHPDRAMTGMVVTAPGCAPLMIDTCGGFELIRQMHKVGLERDAVRNVIVTHRHLDHAGGIQALLLARVPLDIYANADTHEGIRTMTAGCFPEWTQHPEIGLHVVRAGTPREIGGFKVSFFDVEHRVPTLAVRVEAHGRTFAFSADCLPCDGAVACAKDADFFLCDAICADADGPEAIARARANVHPTAREAAVMATRAGAKRLACTHVGRFGSAEKILAEASAHFSGPAIIAQDGAAYEV